MKHLRNILIILVILLIPVYVKAEDATYECNIDPSLECTFNVTKGKITCKYDGKSVDVADPVDQVRYEDINDIVRKDNGQSLGRQLNNRYYLDNMKCPDVAYKLVKQHYIGSDEIQILFLEKATYKMSDGSEKGFGEFADFRRAQLDYTSSNYIGTPTMYNQKLSGTCTTDLDSMISELDDIGIRFVNQCEQTPNAEGCTDLKKEYQEKINKANDLYTDCLNNPNADKSKMDRLAQQIDTHKSFDDRILPDETTTTKKTEKTYDFSNDGCPLGPEITKDLSGALRVMRILAPIFVFVYTVFDIIVAITKGDVQAEGKAMLTKFLKRVAAALTLFAIPVLIDVLMQVFNVWDSSGHCSFYGTETKTTTTTTKPFSLDTWYQECIDSANGVSDGKYRDISIERCNTKKECLDDCGNLPTEAQPNCRENCLK